MTGQTLNGTTVNGTKRPAVRLYEGWQPIHLGVGPAAPEFAGDDEYDGVEVANPWEPDTTQREPTITTEPAYDPIKLAEADRIRALAEAEADAIRTKAEEEARKQKLANDRADRRAAEEQAASQARIAESNRKRYEAERARVAAAEHEQRQRDEQDAADAEIKTADDKWRTYAIWFAVVCGIVSLPVQMSFFWNPKAPWMAAAPLMLEGAAWVVHRGARAAVANRRPVWHYRTIVWLLALLAAGVNLYHGLHAFDLGTAVATAFASIAGPGVWDLHEHGRIRKRDGVLTRRERKAQKKAEAAAAAAEDTRRAEQKKAKDDADKAAKEAAEKLAKDRETNFPEVWKYALKLASALGETTVTETVWRRAHKDVQGTEPGDSAEAQNLRNAAARRLLEARAGAPEKGVWKDPAAQVNSQVPPTRRRGPVTGPTVRGVRRPGDTQPFVNAARKQAAITAKNATENATREDS